MKRFFLFFLSLIFSLFFISCEKASTLEITSTENQTTTQTTDYLSTNSGNSTDFIETTETIINATDLYDLPEVYDLSTVFTSYAENVSCQAYKFNPQLFSQEVYIDVEFTNITYLPVLNKISLSFQISDSSPDNAIYYAMLQNRDNLQILTEKPIFGLGTEFSSEVEFDISDRGVRYNILIGKIDGDNSELGIGYLRPSTLVTWNDLDLDERNNIVVASLVDDSDEFIDSLVFSSAKFNLEIDDVNQSVETVEAKLYNENDMYLATIVSEADSLRSDNKLLLESEFTEIVPNVTYKLNVYVSGSDNQDEFQDVLIGSITLDSAQLLIRESYSSVVSRDGLYAVIYDISYTDEAVVVSYYCDNQEIYLNDETQEAIQLHLEYQVRSTNLTIVYDLTNGYNTVEIPLEVFLEQSYLIIYDSDNDMVFEYTYLPTLHPSVSISASSYFDYNIYINNDNDNIISVKAEIYVEGFPTCIESFENLDFNNPIAIKLYHDFSDIYKSIIIRVVITYSAYGKEFTYIYNDNFF